MGKTSRARHRKILKLAKGYRGRGKNCYTIAIRRVHKALARAYVGRKLKKRTMRTVWIQRMNATCRLFGTTYSRFIADEVKAGVFLNRKVLAELAVTEPCTYKCLVETFKLINGQVIGVSPVKITQPDHSRIDLKAELDKLGFDGQ